MNGGPHLSTALLHSSFGRRLFVLFCLAALIPAATVFWMTYHTATAEVDAWRLRALREGSKDFALGVYTRLQLAEGALAAADADGARAGFETGVGPRQPFTIPGPVGAPLLPASRSRT